MCSTNRRCRCLGPMPSLAASVSTRRPSRPCSSIRRRPRETVADVPCHAGVPGATSGWQRRHGRKPAAAAPAAVAKYRTFRSQRAGRGTNRPAVDSGRHDGDEESSVEARVAREPCTPPRELHRSHTSRYGTMAAATSRFRTWSPVDDAAGRERDDDPIPMWNRPGVMPRLNGCRLTGLDRIACSWPADEQCIQRCPVTDDAVVAGCCCLPKQR